MVSAMAVQLITSAQAIALLGSDAIFLDVRSVPEFEAGHAPGAYNVPLMHLVGGAMTPNASFAEDLAALSLPRDATVVVSCKAGGRSARAAAMLVQLGYTRVLDHGGGWGGNATDPGWVRAGGPQPSETEPGRGHRGPGR